MPSRPRWWRYAVLRGEGVPRHLQGVWFDLFATDSKWTEALWWCATLQATDKWEQNQDGDVAVVYEWIGGDEHRHPWSGYPI